MTRRTFLGLASLVLGALGTVLLAFAWNGPHGRLGFFGPRRDLATVCPYLNSGDGDASGPAAESLRAYAAIEQTLAAGSLQDVPQNAARIAKFFREVNPDIAASAHRLTRQRDLPAARAEFRRLTDLFSRPPDGPPTDGADTSRPLLEI